MAAETVTVLFTDLVGSTELLSRVGETRAEELRREHFSLLRAEVTAAGGREVKNLGDGLMVVFSGAAAALEAAVGMQQAIASRRSDEPMAIRVGVATGDADADDGDYFGLPVVEAARLCAAAGAGEILVTDLVRLLGRSRSEVDLEPVGDLELKGLDEPVAAHRVRWALTEAADDRPPFPPRLATAADGRFVGRGTEHEQLSWAWKEAETQAERRVALVSGEPGIGKTTLSARFAREVHDQGAIVVYGRCDEDLGIPYQPWIEALRDLVLHAPEAALEAHVAERGGHIGRLLPELARRIALDAPTGGDSDTERFALFGCVVDLLERLSVDRPLLLVLDDLHWTDRPTTQLLRHVVTAGRALRVTIVGTFRDSDVTAGHPLTEVLAALHRETGTARIALRGLDDDDVLALLEDIAGHAMDDEGVALRDALLTETSGNPFFVSEILRHLAETGAIYQRDDGRWVSDSDVRSQGLPISVREVVGRRLAGLGPDSERALALASVIGRDFEVPLLASVSGLDEDAVIDLCDAAVAAAILRTTDDPDRYSFAHALIEHTLYDGLSPARRTRAHRAVAEQLERVWGDDPDARAGELAHHWAAAVQPSDSAKALHYAEVAAARALDQLAPDEAVRWFSRALELSELVAAPDPRHRAELLVGLGDAQRQAGVGAHRETLLEAAARADEIGDVDLLVRAVLANNRGFQSVIGAVDHERTAMIERALERVGAEPSAERAMLLTLSAIESTYAVDLEERLGRAREAVEQARACGDRPALAMTLSRPFTAISHASTVPLQAEWAAEAAALADEIGDGALRYWAATNTHGVAATVGDGDLLDAARAIMDEEAQRVPHTTIRWNRLFNEAWTVGLRGDVAGYERLAQEALAVAEEGGEVDAFTMYAIQLANIRYHQGRLGELLPLIDDALAETPDLDAYRAARVAAVVATGDLPRARRLLEEDLEGGFALRRDAGWLVGLSYWAEAAWRLDMPEAAPILRPRLAPSAAHLTLAQVVFQAGVAHYLGLLDHLAGNLDEAVEWFRQADDLHRRLRSPLLVAQAEAAWATTLARRGEATDRAEARAMAERARAAAAAGGWGQTERDAEAVLGLLT